MLLGYYNYTVILTYLSLIISVYGSFLAFNGDIKKSVVCLMLSGLCDMFDGKVARMRERTDDEKRFGIQIDSLCDLICFGMLPAIICYQMSHDVSFYIFIAMLYVLNALIRLAYFNVMEEKRQTETTEVRKTYQGLPVTSISLLLPLIYILNGNNETIAYTILIFVVAICFILPLKIPKPKNKGMFLMMIFGLCELFLIVMGA